MLHTKQKCSRRNKIDTGVLCRSQDIKSDFTDLSFLYQVSCYSTVTPPCCGHWRLMLSTTQPGTGARCAREGEFRLAIRLTAFYPASWSRAFAVEVCRLAHSAILCLLYPRFTACSTSTVLRFMHSRRTDRTDLGRLNAVVDEVTKRTKFLQRGTMVKHL